MTPDSPRYSDSTYLNSRGQYGPAVAEEPTPIYCADCKDAEVDEPGEVCQFCKIYAAEGEAAADAWWVRTIQPVLIAASMALQMKEVA